MRNTEVECPRCIRYGLAAPAPVRVMPVQAPQAAPAVTPKPRRHPLFWTSTLTSLLVPLLGPPVWFCIGLVYTAREDSAESAFGRKAFLWALGCGTLHAVLFGYGVFRSYLLYQSVLDSAMNFTYNF
ncbi:MAG: hypothetical protein ACYDBB_06205 [Armatimonadota bacterium]